MICLFKGGKSFTFKNNSRWSNYGTYTAASAELLSWIATVEEFISQTYGEDSAAFKLFKKIRSEHFNGHEEDDFNEEMQKIIGSLETCKYINPRKKRGDDNHIIRLIKNPSFWITVVAIGSGAFTVGTVSSSSKFDKEKTDYYNQTISQQYEIDNLRKSNAAKDSIITSLQESVSGLQDTLRKSKSSYAVADTK